MLAAKIMQKFKSSSLDFVLFLISTTATIVCNGASTGDSGNISLTTTTPAPDLCIDFLRTDNDHTFTSPKYPSLYPNQLDCVRKIEAPTDQHYVRLDFRGHFFQLEEPRQRDLTCDHDYLEVRDGAYGFSPLLGQFCGKRFPNSLLAKSGTMWLRFKTDRNIQYKGFKAVYSFQPMTPHEKMEDRERRKKSCYHFITDDDGIISSPALLSSDKLLTSNATTSDPFHCVWKITAKNPAYKIRLFFQMFELAFPNDCQANYMEIYHSDTAANHLLRQLCSTTANKLDIGSNSAYIRIYLTVPTISLTKIQVIHSVYLHSKNCSAEYFSCGDETCIPESLVCNGIANCLYQKDEDSCKKWSYQVRFETGPYLAILVVISAIIVGIVCCTIITNTWPRCRPKQHISLELDPTARTAARQSTQIALSPVRLSKNSHDVNGTTTFVPLSVDVDEKLLLEIIPKMSCEDMHALLTKRGCSLPYEYSIEEAEEEEFLPFCHRRPHKLRHDQPLSEPVPRKKPHHNHQNNKSPSIVTTQIKVLSYKFNPAPPDILPDKVVDGMHAASKSFNYSKSGSFNKRVSFSQDSPTLSAKLQQNQQQQFIFDPIVHVHHKPASSSFAANHSSTSNESLHELSIDRVNPITSNSESDTNEINNDICRFFSA